MGLSLLGLRLGLGFLCSGFSLLFASCVLCGLLVVQTALFRQFFFLAAQQFCITVGFVFAANQLGVFGSLNLRSRYNRIRLSVFNRQIRFIFAPDKGALLDGLNGDGTGLASGISLLDF